MSIIADPTFDLSGLVGARFDWYAATIRDDITTILRVLGRELGGEVVSGNSKQGYAVGHHIRVDGSNVVTIFSGGRNGHPHAYASSDDTEAFVRVVRSYWPDSHHVTRMDACFDFDNGPGTWDALAAVCLAVADAEPAPGDLRRRPKKVKVGQLGDWHRFEDGRTIRLGSAKSAVSANLYEKGKELRVKAEAEGRPRPNVSDDWVRLEVRVRPDGDSRFTAALGTPDEAFGYADWTRELARRVAGLDIERVHVKERRETDHERAMFWLVRQYGAHLAEEAELLGGWELLGASLARRIQAAAEHPDDIDPGADPMPHTFDGFMQSPF